MPITIELPPAVERWLAGRAAAQGTTPASEAAAVLARAAGVTLADVLAPFRQSIAEAGLSDEELGALVEEARQEIWDERHAPGGPA